MARLPYGRASGFVKTARERANIAAAAIRRGQTTSRSFDTCFEMGDGDEVVRCLLKKAKKDARIRAFAIHSRWIVAPGEPLGSPIYEVDPTLVAGAPFPPRVQPQRRPRAPRTYVDGKGRRHRWGVCPVCKDTLPRNGGHSTVDSRIVCDDCADQTV